MLNGWEWRWWQVDDDAEWVDDADCWMRGSDDTGPSPSILRISCLTALCTLIHFFISFAFLPSYNIFEILYFIGCFSSSLLQKTRPSMRYWPTNRQTDRPTDTASYKGALSHLKKKEKYRRLKTEWFFFSDSNGRDSVRQSVEGALQIGLEWNLVQCKNMIWTVYVLIFILFPWFVSFWQPF